MAKSRLCSIEGCGKRHFGRGFCNAHYSRLRKYGDPLGNARRKLTQVQSFLRNVVILHEDDACLIWPFAKNGAGYPHMLHDGSYQLVHRLVCKIAHGEPPSNKHQAAHSCGERTCVNKRHIRWATQIENEQDKLIHGTRQRGERCYNAQVTEIEARKILSLKGKMKQREIGALFGVSEDLVSQIHRRVRWSWLS